jgi:general stress protein YciG
MAKDDEKKPTAAEKGKGKAVNGDVEKDKDVKKDLDDKKGGVATTGGMFARGITTYNAHILMASCRGA